MKRPEASLENYQAVYDHYREFRPDPRVQRRVIAVFSKVFDPYYHIAEGALEAAAERLEAGHRLVMTCTHHKLSDQFLPGKLLWEDERLESIVGNAFVPAKAGYYKYRWTQALFDHLGATVVFRGAVDGGDRELVDAAKEEFTDMSVERMVVDGQHIFVFPFGTRDKSPDGRSVLRRRDTSVMDITYRASQEAAVSGWPMAIYWGERKYMHLPGGTRLWVPDFSRRPDFVVGMPIDGPFESPQQTMNLFHDSMTDLLEIGVQARLQRLGKAAVAS